MKTCGQCKHLVVDARECYCRMYLPNIPGKVRTYRDSGRAMFCGAYRPAKNRKDRRTRS